MTRIHRLAAAAGAVALLVAAVAPAQEGPWMVRVRAINIQPADKSTAYPPLGIPADRIDVSSKWAPDIDFEWFFARRFSAELLLTVPQRHDVVVRESAIGAAALGSFKHLPPTLTLKYNFLPEGTIRPYVGAGLNYTRISDVRLRVPTATPIELDLDRSSVGPAAQAGFDVAAGGPWFASVDVKWVDIDADVTVRASGARISTVKVDPWLYGVGVGYRFGGR